jgi:hypothetical protein
MVSIVKPKPIQEVWTVLALVESKIKVSFGEAWHALQSNEVRTHTKEA